MSLVKKFAAQVQCVGQQYMVVQLKGSRAKTRSGACLMKQVQHMLLISYYLDRSCRRRQGTRYKHTTINIYFFFLERILICNIWKCAMLEAGHSSMGISVHFISIKNYLVHQNIFVLTL